MDYIREINVMSPDDINGLREFLAGFDLWLDEIDYGVIMERDGKIVGSCCKLKNIFKCFAIHPSLQGEGVTNQLLTQVSYQVFQEGYLHSFVYTKPENTHIFSSLGFTQIVMTDTVSLLEKGTKTIGQHIDFLKKQYGIDSSNHGAIVMNGNPFTLGHQYLIEMAASQCERLIVFVVEEEASSFPFLDRLALIQKGTSHLSNVIVVPSSHYMISQATFPNYFLRDKDNGFASYAKLDVTIFGQWFARELHITKRFVGEEPLDPMTNQYNQTMIDVLPSFDVSVTIIPRKQNDTGVISASKVRVLLKQERWEDVKQFVPMTTYTYLKEATDIIDGLKKHDRKH